MSVKNKSLNIVTIFTPLIPIIRRCGWLLTLKGKTAVIHRLSDHCHGNIGIWFWIEDNMLTSDWCAKKRYRNTVSQLTSTTPEYRQVNNKSDIEDCLVVLIATKLLRGIDHFVWDVNKFYKGGLTDRELNDVRNKIYQKAAARANIITGGH